MLLGVGPWLRGRALPFRYCGWNCRGTSLITSSRLLSVDWAAAADKGECGSNSGSPQHGPTCHPLKVKADSGWLYGVSATSSMASSTVGDGGRIWQCNILYVGGGSLLSPTNNRCDVTGVLYSNI